MWYLKKYSKLGFLRTEVLFIDSVLLIKEDVNKNITKK